jgi:hypothetical protein
MSNTFQEPSWGTPSYSEAPTKFGTTPPLITDLHAICVRLVQAHFADAHNIRNPKLANLLYDGSRSGSLQVRPVYTDDLRTYKGGEEIHVMRGELAVTELDRGRKLQIRLNGVDRYDPQRRSLLEQVPFIFLCRTKAPAVAEGLGQEVYDLFLYYADTVSSEFLVDTFEPKGIGTVQVSEDSNRNMTVYTVQVAVNISLYRSWSVDTEEVY